VPEALNDRAQDLWRPLLAIAEVVGKNWTGKARNAALALSTGEAATDSSAGVLLLSDIQALFADRNTDRLSSDEIVAALAGMEDRPWPEWKNGKPMTKNQLARLLGRYHVTPQTIRIGDQTAKGYMLDRLKDAFGRYTPFQNVTTSQTTPDADCSPTSKRHTGSSVTDCETSQPAPVLSCDGVTDQEPVYVDQEEI